MTQPNKPGPSWETQAAEKDFFERRGFHPDEFTWRDAQYGLELRTFIAGIKCAQEKAAAPGEESWEKLREIEFGKFYYLKHEIALKEENEAFHKAGFDAAVNLIARPLKAANLELAAMLKEDARDTDELENRLTIERDSARAEAASLRAENERMKCGSDVADRLLELDENHPAITLPEWAKVRKSLMRTENDTLRARLAEASMRLDDLGKALVLGSPEDIRSRTKEAGEFLAKLKAGRKEEPSRVPFQGSYLMCPECKSEQGARHSPGCTKPMEKP